MLTKVARQFSRRMNAGARTQNAVNVWEKHGAILTPAANSWNVSSAMLPVVDDEDRGGRVRVYFSGRDEAGRGRIGYLDADLGPSRNGALRKPSSRSRLGSIRSVLTTAALPPDAS